MARLDELGHFIRSRYAWKVDYESNSVRNIVAKLVSFLHNNFTMFAEENPLLTQAAQIVTFCDKKHKLVII